MEKMAKITRNTVALVALFITGCDSGGNAGSSTLEDSLQVDRMEHKLSGRVSGLTSRACSPQARMNYMSWTPPMAAMLAASPSPMHWKKTRTGCADCSHSNQRLLVEDKKL